MAKLYMMFGYPGAGKTTVAKLLSNVTGATRLSSDEVRMQLFPRPTFSQTEHDALYTALDTHTEELLHQGHDVIYDANLNRYKHRKDKYDICQRSHATPVLIWVQTEKTLSKNRAMHESREHLWPPGETADAMFDRIADIIQEPGPGEPYIVIDGTNVSEEYIKTQLGL